MCVSDFSPLQANNVYHPFGLVDLEKKKLEVCVPFARYVKK